ncbi:glutamate receptor 2.5-like [Silene latifolia]|uniref:glutamate receptor 2.5-like n=1 Tax=Silene latifolia TaxID=37657 RepID=UPI003D77C88C
MPYLESPISMLVPRNHNAISSGVSLIRITSAFLITAYALSFIAATIYVLSIAKCARIFGGNENNAPRDAELGAIIHTRLLMTTFLLVIIVLLGCYIVSQASSNTPRGSATITNLTQLKEKDANVGYTEGSFIFDILKYKGFSESKLKSLNSAEEMADMLSKGGVDAIVANEPHLKLLQAKYCDNFTIVTIPNIHSTGIGFAFWIDSNLGSNVSEGILKMTDNGRLGKIQDRTIGNLDACSDYLNNDLDVASSFLPPRYNWILIVGGSLIGLLSIVSFFFLF